MNLKKITDPEEVLLLWQAGLLVTREGRLWGKHVGYFNNAYVIVEES